MAGKPPQPRTADTPLTDRERQYVLLRIEHPTRPKGQCYADAGWRASTTRSKSGNSSAEWSAWRLEKQPNVAKALADARAAVLAQALGRQVELRSLWWKMANDEALPAKTRLRATELLARTEGMFKDRLELTGRLTLAELLAQAGEPEHPPANIHAPLPVQ